MSKSWVFSSYRLSNENKKRGFTLVGVGRNVKTFFSEIIHGSRFPEVTVALLYRVANNASTSKIVSDIMKKPIESAVLVKSFANVDKAISRISFVDKGKVHKDIRGAEGHPGEVIYDPLKKDTEITYPWTHASNIKGAQPQYNKIKSFYNKETGKKQPFITENLGKPDLDGKNIDQYRHLIPLVDDTKNELMHTRWYNTITEQRIFVNKNVESILEKVINHVRFINGPHGTLTLYYDSKKPVLDYKYSSPHDLRVDLIILQAISVFEKKEDYRRMVEALLKKRAEGDISNSKALVSFNEKGKLLVVFAPGDKKHISWEEVARRKAVLGTEGRFAKILPEKKDKNFNNVNILKEVESKKGNIIEIDDKGNPVRHIGDKVDDFI